jgi:hypothetical protein
MGKESGRVRSRLGRDEPAGAARGLCLACLEPCASRLRHRHRRHRSRPWLRQLHLHFLPSTHAPDTARLFDKLEHVIGKWLSTCRHVDGHAPLHPSRPQSRRTSSSRADLLPSRMDLVLLNSCLLALWHRVVLCSDGTGGTAHVGENTGDFGGGGKGVEINQMISPGICYTAITENRGDAFMKQDDLSAGRLAS